MSDKGDAGVERATRSFNFSKIEVRKSGDNEIEARLVKRSHHFKRGYSDTASERKLFDLRSGEAELLFEALREVLGKDD